MRILILEDSKERISQFKQRLIGHSVYVTKDPKTCIDWLKKFGYFDYLFLDHDMGLTYDDPVEGTGYEVAQWLSENTQYTPGKILIHSLNNVGAAAMMSVLGRVGIRASYIPFLWTKVNI